MTEYIQQKKIQIIFIIMIGHEFGKYLDFHLKLKKDKNSIIKFQFLKM